MTREQELALAMSMAEVAVQNMAEAGIGPMARAVALAFHMQRQAGLAMPDDATAAAFKLAIGTK